MPGDPRTMTALRRKGRKALSQRQRRFVEELLQDPNMNLTQAAKRAGYKTASEMGSVNLKKPHVIAYLDKLIAERNERVDINIDRVLKEITAMAYVDPKDLMDESGNFLPIDQMPEHARRAIASFDASVVQQPGEDTPEVKVIKVRFWDKNASVDKLMRHLGAYAKDNDQKGLLSDAERAQVQAIADYVAKMSPELDSTEDAEG